MSAGPDSDIAAGGAQVYGTPLTLHMLRQLFELEAQDDKRKLDVVAKGARV